MIEYIDREAAIASLCCDCSATGDCRPGERCVDYARLKEIPAADVVEVRHGRWEFTEDVDMPWCTKAVCTYCGVTIADNIDLSQSFGRKRFIRYNRYCADCGAKMDGGQDDV